MSNDKNDFFLHSNVVNHISKEDYDKIELLVNAAKAFARSTYQCVYIIDYFHQDFIYASDNLAYLCGLEPEQLMEAGYQMYIDHVPDADLQMLIEVNKKGFDHFNELPVGDRLDYTISYDFHLTNGRHRRLSAQGYTMNDIADRLCKSVDTIKACKRNLFAKLGVKNIAEALFHATNYQMI